MKYLTFLAFIVLSMFSVCSIADTIKTITVMNNTSYKATFLKQEMYGCVAPVDRPTSIPAHSSYQMKFRISDPSICSQFTSTWAWDNVKMSTDQPGNLFTYQMYLTNNVNDPLVHGATCYTDPNAYPFKYSCYAISAEEGAYIGYQPSATVDSLIISSEIIPTTK